LILSIAGFVGPRKFDWILINQNPDGYFVGEINIHGVVEILRQEFLESSDGGLKRVVFIESQILGAPSSRRSAQLYQKPRNPRSSVRNLDGHIETQLKNYNPIENQGKSRFVYFSILTISEVALSVFLSEFPLILVSCLFQANATDWTMLSATF
jgi:hypothetical protein